MNQGYEASLDVGRVYLLARPEKHDPASMLRVIDNDGEDYLFDALQFESISPREKARKLLAAVSNDKRGR